MKMSVFVRIRPDRVEEEPQSDPGQLESELEELVALAGAPLALDPPAE